MSNRQKYNILDFGAKPGELCTKSIQAALDASDRDGGGTVVIPSGTYISGTINLGKSSLKLEKGAVLKGSSDISDYTFFGYEHNEMGKATSLIYSVNSENIRIYGEGIIDLNGDAFFRERDWYVPNSKIELAQDQIEECTLNVYSRINQPIFFYRCRNVKLEGIKIINSPCWTVTFCECQDVKVMYITIDNSLNVPKDDGITSPVQRASSSTAASYPAETTA